jgi:AraC family transcriptional regulator of adaptative response / DNA-3-methyladenine glycosylase II
MELAPDICYRAMTSRDGRFDGRFFVGVRTTGIYCRPVCPAPKPKRRNVLYFSCAAAAEEAGFRPCLRCRPEASPGTPAWVGTSATVTRALRMIAEGALDDGRGVDELAGRLGMGGRNLRRLFAKHLGASPKSVALTRRIHFAKTLIDTTSLAMTDIAYSAGFASIRRFNDAFKLTFRRSPREVRAGATPPTSSALFEIRLPYRPPFDWQQVLSFLGPRAVPGVEHVDGVRYHRAVAIGDCAGVVDIVHAADRHQLVLSVPIELARHAATIAANARRLFDVGAFPEEVASHLERDRLLAPLINRWRGVRVPGAWSPFETAIRAILGQQVTVSAATTIAGRLVERYGRAVRGVGPGLTHVFPEPERLAASRLDRFGIPRGRAVAIREMAKAFRDGRVRFDGSMDLESLVAAMTALRGVGPWTAQYVAMRAGGEPDAFPAGDLALRRAVLRCDSDVTTERKLIERAEPWRPWRAYATMLLWMDYAVQKSKGEVR